MWLEYMYLDSPLLIKSPCLAFIKQNMKLEEACKVYVLFVQPDAVHILMPKSAIFGKGGSGVLTIVHLFKQCSVHVNHLLCGYHWS